MGDMISRQAAITAIQKAYADTVGGTDRCAVWKNVGLTNALHIMQDLPSVQPEKMQLSTEKTQLSEEDATFDCISRQTAIDALQSYSFPNAPMVESGIKIAINLIETLPSVQPERKKGKWIDVDDSYNRIRGICSVCGWQSHMYEDDVVGMNFCPNCGADMREEQEC